MKTSSLIHLRRTLFASAMLLTVSAFAQTPNEYPLTPKSSPPDNSNTMLQRGDKNFVTKAAKANAEEIDIAKVAADRAVRPEVRSFAQMLASDHDTLGSRLARLASTKNVMLEPIDADMVKKWSEKKASEFDKDYVKEMVSAHKKAVSLYEDAAKDAKDPDVAAFARKQLDTLNAHLRKAQELEKLLD